jgi:hypothetical protein
MAEKVWWLSVMTHEKYLSYGGLSSGERWMWGQRADMQVDEEMTLLSFHMFVHFWTGRGAHTWALWYGHWKVAWSVSS